MRYLIAFIGLMFVSAASYAQQGPPGHRPPPPQEYCGCAPGDQDCMYGVTVTFKFDTPEGDPLENVTVWTINGLPHDLAQKIYQTSIAAVNEQGAWNYIHRALRCEGEATGALGTMEQKLKHTFQGLIGNQ